MNIRNGEDAGQPVKRFGVKVSKNGLKETRQSSTSGYEAITEIPTTESSLLIGKSTAKHPSNVPTVRNAKPIAEMNRIKDVGSNDIEKVVFKKADNRRANKAADNTSGTFAWLGIICFIGGIFTLGITCILGLVFSIIGAGRNRDLRGLAILGIVLNALGAIVGIALIIFLLTFSIAI